MAAALNWTVTGPFHAQIRLLRPRLSGTPYGTAPDLTALLGQPRTSPSMPTPAERVMPAVVSRPTSPRTTAKATLAAAPAIRTPVILPAAADALEVLRRLCPLTDVVDALGANSAEYDGWVAAGLTWPNYVQPAGHRLVDPAAVLASMTSEVAA